VTKPKSGRYPWMKWWTRVWLGDPALRSCSAGARGIWADIVSTIHEEGEDGALLFKGKPPSTERLARITGCSPREYLKLEHELEEAGVFDRRESDGAIICRKTARDSGSDGAPEGHPEGDPSGIPSSSVGLPASRACARADLSHLSSSSSPEGSAEGAADPLPELIEHWGREWARTRSGTKATVREKDRASVAWMLDQAEAENVRRRMTAMLEDPEPFVLKHASLKLLESKWDAYAVAASKNGKHAPSETAEQTELRERWNLLQSRRVRDRKAAGIPPWPGFEAARREIEGSAVA
jgi:hypothetical protein